MVVLSRSKIFAPKSDIPPHLYACASVLAFALLLAAWSALTYGGLVPPLFLPAPDDIVRNMIELFRDFGLLADVGASVLRVTAGFLLSAAIGVPLGVLMGSLRICEAFFEPFLGFIRYMPASAFIPLFNARVADKDGPGLPAGLQFAEQALAVLLPVLLVMTLLLELAAWPVTFALSGKFNGISACCVVAPPVVNSTCSASIVALAVPGACGPT